MKMINLVAASVLLATTSVAMADAVVTAQNNGFYAGVLAGYGKANYVGDHVINKNHGIDGGLKAGYMLTNNFGVETGFIQYSPVKLSDGKSITQNYNLYVAGVAQYDLTNEFNVFGKLGLARVHTKLPETLTIDNVAVAQGGYSKFTAFAGAGVGYKLTQNIELSVEGDLTTKSSKIPAMMSLNTGVAYIF